MQSTHKESNKLTVYASKLSAVEFADTETIAISVILSFTGADWEANIHTI